MNDTQTLYPLTFEPELKEKVWGGRRLGSVLGKELPPDGPVGESWEVHGGSVVAAGAHAGRKLEDLVRELGADLIGSELTDLPGGKFPLLLKYIDASEWLSVQVHPDDEYARAHTGEPNGKTEAWYIIHAEPGAQLVHGWKRPVGPDEVEVAVRENRLEELLEYVEVSAGDVVFVPAGTVHSIGGGIVLAEIQQSSDTTYRLYDWGRMGLDGKPRDLHLRESLETLNYGVIEEHKTPPREFPCSHVTCRVLVRSDYFVVHSLEGESSFDTVVADYRFELLTVIEGAIGVRWDSGQLQLRRGQTALMPAALGKWRLVSEAPFKVLRMYKPVGFELFNDMPDDDDEIDEILAVSRTLADVVVEMRRRGYT